jgi:hypothetical protein
MRGEVDKALDAISDLRRLSPCGRLQREGISVIDAIQHHDGKKLDDHLDDMGLHKDDAPSTCQDALLDANRLDAAADLLIERLRDADERGNALTGGVTYQYFLDGPATASDTDFRGARLHASNAVFSGSNQEGADDVFLFLGNDGTVYTWNTLSGGGTYCPGCVGWNKTSDGNVQVFALIDRIFASGFEGAGAQR